MSGGWRGWQTKMLELGSGRQTRMLATENGRVDRHPGIRCDECQAAIGDGVRYVCLDCPDYDLCDACEGRHPGTHANGTHVFAKLRDTRAVGGSVIVDTYRRK